MHAQALPASTAVLGCAMTLLLASLARSSLRGTPAAAPQACHVAGLQQLDVSAVASACSAASSRWAQPSGSAPLTQQCFQLLAGPGGGLLPASAQHQPAQLLVHTFWAGDMTWQLRLVIQSFLFTHHAPAAGEAACAGRTSAAPVLIVWLQREGGVDRALLEAWAEQWRAPFFLCARQLQFRAWPTDAWLAWLPDSVLGPAAAAQRPALQQALREAGGGGSGGGSNGRPAPAASPKGSKGNKSSVALSDLVRFLVLFHEGGVYVDADVLLLRDLRPLAHWDWVHEWSATPHANTAVMGLRRGSPVAAHVLRHGLAEALRPQPGAPARLGLDLAALARACHPHRLLRGLPPAARDALAVLPSLLFDPLWLTRDNANKSAARGVAAIHGMLTFGDLLAAPASHVSLPPRASDAFKGAFAVHWHNQWGAQLEPASLFGRLQQEYEAAGLCGAAA